jgi:hypothetical protein
VEVGERGVARRDAEAHLHQISVLSAQAELGPLQPAEVVDEDKGTEDD